MGCKFLRKYFCIEPDNLFLTNYGLNFSHMICFLPALMQTNNLFLQTEVHDVCHCLRTSYDKLSQVLLVRTIQLPNSIMAVSSSDIATESPSTGQLKQ